MAKQVDLDKVLKSNSETFEEKILRGIFKRGSAIADCIEIITPECFSIPDYKAIYTSMYELHKDSQRINNESVEMWLEQNGYNVNFDVIERLYNESYTSLQLKTTCMALRELYQRREMLGSLREIIDGQDQCPTSSLDILDQINNIAMKSNEIISSDEQDTKCCSNPNDTLIKINELLNRRQDDMGLRTGVKVIDEQLRGLLGGKLWVLCADSQVGKSQFAVQLAVRALELNDNVDVQYYSLEMSKEEVEQRSQAILADIEPKFFTNPRSYFTRVDDKTGEFKNLYDINPNCEEVQDFKKRIGNACRFLNSVNFDIDEAGDLDIHQICARIKTKFLRRKDKNRKTVIIIDHMNICCGASSISEEVSLLKEGYRVLKNLAKKYDCTIIALHQFTKGDLVKDELHKPNIFALTGGSAPRNYADIICCIWRPGVYRDVIDKNPTLKDHCDIDFQKVRYTRKPDVTDFTYNGYEFKEKAPKQIQGNIDTPAYIDDNNDIDDLYYDDKDDE